MTAPSLRVPVNWPGLMWHACAGHASVDTHKMQDDAADLVQILRQWGELKPDLADMQRYAAWKAADIRKAIREGRAPTAGPPENAESADLATLLDLPSVTHGLHSQHQHPACRVCHL